MQICQKVFILDIIRNVINRNKAKHVTFYVRSDHKSIDVVIKTPTMDF